MISLTIDGKNVTVAEGTTILDAAAELGISDSDPLLAAEGFAHRRLPRLRRGGRRGGPDHDRLQHAGQGRDQGHHPVGAAYRDPPQGHGADAGQPSPRLPGLRCRRRVRPAGRLLRPERGQARNIRPFWSAGRSAMTGRLIESDPNRCILCEKCVKVDHEVVGCDAIAVVNRGEATIIDTVDGGPLDCEFCGNCVARLPDRHPDQQAVQVPRPPLDLHGHQSVCAFCSAGCQIEYHAGTAGWSGSPARTPPINSGNLCINGRFGYSYLNTPGPADHTSGQRGEVATGTRRWTVAVAADQGRSSRSGAPMPWPASARRGSPTRRATSSRNCCAAPSAPATSIPRRGSAIAQAQAVLREHFGFHAAPAPPSTGSTRLMQSW